MNNEETAASGVTDEAIRYPIRNKDIPQLAQRCLREYDVTSLPVDLLQITDRAGVKVMKNSSFDEDSDFRLKERERGMSYYNYHTGQWYVIYDDTQSLQDKRFTIAHEIGHIYLKHNEEKLRFMAYIEDLNHKHSRRVERQANLFAKCLLKGVPNESNDTNTSHR